VLGFGSASETFIVDRMRELDRLGWEAWVGAKWLVDEPLFEFPPPARVIAPRPRDEWRRRFSLRGAESWWLERPISKVRPTLIHAHFGWTGIEAVGAARRHGMPIAVGFHGYDATVYPRYGFDAHDRAGGRTMPVGVYDEVFAQSDAILASSDFIASKLRDLGCDREIDVVRSGIRLEDFAFRGPREDAVPGRLRLVFIGRIVPYKGLDIVLEAMAKLIESDVSPSLVVVGEGPDRPACEELAAELGLADRVDFRGRQPRTAVRAALGEADALVFPSRTTPAGQAEGLGNVAKEALAVGLELVASDNGGISETIPAERHGELVAEGDPEALATRLLEIDCIRGEWPQRALEGRRWIEAEFSWRKLADRLDEVYRRIAPRHP
jgi:colanic acid/amylovoran biosynthesis glycosyltransferase